MIAGSSTGDVLAFQYSGHGTEVPDIDGDEEPGFNSDADEAICPVDFAGGKLIIDDELRAELANLPEGVSFTGFSDCCHSGSNMRAFGTGDKPAVGDNKKARFIVATPDLIAKHREFRRNEPIRRAVVTSEQLRHVSMAACRDEEVAFESNGHGHFTTHAMQVLSQGTATLTNKTFTQQVTSRFGASPEQHPVLDCRAEFEGQPLLAGVGAPAQPAVAPGISADAGPERSTTVGAHGNDGSAAVSDLLRALAGVLDSGASNG
jgi:hypothetical protein